MANLLARLECLARLLHNGFDGRVSRGVWSHEPIKVVSSKFNKLERKVNCVLEQQTVQWRSE